MALLRLSLAAYRLPRTVGTEGVQSRLLTATRGITAVSGFATSELRLLMMEVVMLVLSEWGADVGLTLYLTVETRGDPLIAAQRCAAAASRAAAARPRTTAARRRRSPVARLRVGAQPCARRSCLRWRAASGSSATLPGSEAGKRSGHGGQPQGAGAARKRERAGPTGWPQACGRRAGAPSLPPIFPRREKSADVETGCGRVSPRQYGGRTAPRKKRGGCGAVSSRGAPARSCRCAGAVNQEAPGWLGHAELARATLGPTAAREQF